MKIIIRIIHIYWNLNFDCIKFPLVISDLLWFLRDLILFCGLSGQITTVDEAKRFYPLFGLGANVALIFSGRTVKYFSNLRKNLGPGVDGWAVSLKGMMSIVVLMGLSICGLYWWVNNNVELPTRSKKKKVIFCSDIILLLVIFQLHQWSGICSWKHIGQHWTRLTFPITCFWLILFKLSCFRCWTCILVFHCIDYNLSV